MNIRSILITLLLLIFFDYQILCHWILTPSNPTLFVNKPIQKIKIDGIIEYCHFKLGRFIGAGWEGTVYKKKRDKKKYQTYNFAQKKSLHKNKLQKIFVQKKTSLKFFRVGKNDWANIIVIVLKKRITCSREKKFPENFSCTEKHLET